LSVNLWTLFTKWPP